MCAVKSLQIRDCAAADISLLRGVPYSFGTDCKSAGYKKKAVTEDTAGADLQSVPLFTFLICAVKSLQIRDSAAADISW